MIFTKDGIVVDGKLITLKEITRLCLIEKVKEEKLLLFKIKWSRRQSTDIYESIVLPIEKIDIIKKVMFGVTIYFGEIEGKHSNVCDTVDDNDVSIVSEESEIVDFLEKHPDGHNYNHSFLETFLEYANDGGYDEDELSKENLELFNTIF